MRGHAKLLEDVTNLADLERIRALFDLLETKKNLLRLIELVQGAQGVQIFIGAENQLFGMTGCSMVVAPYETADEERPSGGQDRRRDRRDRADPHELRPHHPDGRLHRAGDFSPAGQSRQRAESMTRHKPTPDDPEHERAAEDGAPDPAAAAAEQPAADGARRRQRKRAAPGEAELEAELADTKDRLLRALAETENLRRRSMRDLQEAHKYAITNFARELLEVADNLSRALDAVPARARDEIEFVRNLADGIAMTEKALLTSFERHQIAKVTPEIGEKFDHNRHQAMFEVESTEQPPGTVAQVLQPGYTIAERLLRPALVAVAKAPPGKAPGR